MNIYIELQKRLNDEPDAVVNDCMDLLNQNPDDTYALFLIGVAYSRAGKHGMSLQFFEKCARLKPKRTESWVNSGMAYQGMGLLDAAEQQYLRGWQVGKSAAVASNLASLYVDRCEWSKAVEWANRALSIDPQFTPAKASLGMAQIAQSNFAGYANLSQPVNNKFRKLIQYQDEPLWDGTKGQTVLVYGEQGLGDEIMYASMFADAAKDAQIMVECDERLEGLFRRSFPYLQIHGTRRTDADWLDDYKLDASIPSGMLTKFYRTSRDAFPGKPYLVADPERRLQWRALFDSWGKRPKIGICWSGGSPYCKPKERHMGLEAFRPLIESLDADFVSLQYKDATEEIEASGLPVRHIKRAVQSPDYDDTAAFVAELDMVIGVHTSVHHLAGSLGVPGLIFVPHKTLWLYAGEFPWYGSARLFRQHKGEAWAQTVKRSLNDPDICRLRSA